MQLNADPVSVTLVAKQNQESTPEVSVRGQVADRFRRALFGKGVHFVQRV